jgi:hypothetical protein
MKTYSIKFTGRKLGAIGKFYSITAEVFADNPQAASAALYDRFEFGHAGPPDVKEIKSPFNGDDLVGRVQNTKEEFDRVRACVTLLRSVMDQTCKGASKDNADWHDDPDAPDHALYHATAEQQFPRTERDRAILELVSRHLETLNENEAAEGKVAA